MPNPTPTNNDKPLSDETMKKVSDIIEDAIVEFYDTFLDDTDQDGRSVLLLKGIMRYNGKQKLVINEMHSFLKEKLKDAYDAGYKAGHHERD